MLLKISSAQIRFTVSGPRLQRAVTSKLGQNSGWGGGERRAEDLSAFVNVGKQASLSGVINCTLCLSLRQKRAQECLFP